MAVVNSRGERRQLPKRLFKTVTIANAAGGVCLLLDGKPIRTPRKARFVLPTKSLAEALAAEWEAQGTHIDPVTMPLTRLANSAIDGVSGCEQQIREEILAYAASDLLCYRAERPEALVRRQSELWDPIVVWGKQALGVRLTIARGLMPISQPTTNRAEVARALDGLDAFELAAVHSMTMLTGSALLVLAHLRDHISAEATWAAATLEEIWQAEQWGVDPQAQAARERRGEELRAASRFLALLKS
jgi:chaperone required for assembly of F1-ATPase